MPKKPRRAANGLPWYRAERDCWCVPGDPKKSPIRDRHGDIVRGQANRGAALAAWHEMTSLANVGRAGAENSVKTVLELYLQDAERRVSAKTLGSYTSFFQSFVDKWPGLIAKDLKPFHVLRWWEEVHPSWGASMRNLSGSALKAAFKWAAAAGGGGCIIPANPLDGMPLPTMRKRASEVVVSDEEFTKLLTLTSPAVRDILVVAWETGTRPVNLTRATRANVSGDGNSLVFADWNTDSESAVHKTFKRTGRPLVIPLPDPVREVVLRLAEVRPEGPLFLSPRGKAWTAVSLANMVAHYAKRAGLDGRFTAYSCRHSRATALLEAGVSDVEVAAVLGNTPAVIHRNYSHVSAKVDRLREVMKKARSGA